jgi:diguanylate cyclase (GGDEF)-like protein
MSRSAWAYVFAVMITGSALTVLALPGLWHRPSGWAIFAVLTVLATAAQLFKAEAPNNHVLFHASPAFFFAGYLLLSPALIVLLVVIPHLVEWIIERRRPGTYLRAWYLQPFNVAMYVITGLVVRWVYQTVHPHLTDVAQPLAVAGFLLAALTFLALNRTLLGLALVLARGVSWRDSGMLERPGLTSDFILLCIGFVIAALWPLNSWFILPALAPLVLMYQALLIPKLKQEAQTDSKTGLSNARHFNDLFVKEMDRARRFGRPVALIMADLDLLRHINNSRGHLAGDAVIAKIGEILRATSREYDVAGRFGGEEFAIVLPEVTSDEALRVAERLRAAVEVAHFDSDPRLPPLEATLSLGVARFPEDAGTLSDLIAAADVALYRAKATGRNRVVSASDGGLRRDTLDGISVMSKTSEDVHDLAVA